MARFKPGQSGNPSGRPAGSRSTTSLLRTEMVTDADVQKIVAKVVAMAKEGDLVAAGMILDRTIPKLRHRVDDVVEEANLAEALQAARLRAAASSGFRVTVLEDLVAASFAPPEPALGGHGQAAMAAERDAPSKAAEPAPEPSQPQPARAFRMRMDSDDDTGSYASGDNYNPLDD